jgi:hypothetical protein
MPIYRPQLDAKADLQPEDGKAPNRITLDETVIHLNDDRF